MAIGHTFLGRPWWRTGVNTEAKLLLLSRAFDELGAVRVVWHTDIRNDRSQRGHRAARRDPGGRAARAPAAPGRLLAGHRAVRDDRRRVAERTGQAAGKASADGTGGVMMAGVLGITDIWTYVLGTVAIILLPGPNSLFVLSTAAKRGVAAGYRAAGGVFVGDGVLMFLSAAGVASLLKAYPPLFLVIKYAGAAYLGYVGVTMLRGAVRRWRDRNDPGTPRLIDAAEPAAMRSPFRQGAGDQPAEPEGDPVLHLVLHPVRRPRLRLAGAVVPAARADRRR